MLFLYSSQMFFNPFLKIIMLTASFISFEICWNSLIFRMKVKMRFGRGKLSCLIGSNVILSTLGHLLDLICFICWILEMLASYSSIGEEEDLERFLGSPQLWSIFFLGGWKNVKRRSISSGSVKVFVLSAAGTSVRTVQNSCFILA